MGTDPVLSAINSCNRLLDRYFEYSDQESGKLSLSRLCKLIDFRIENLHFLPTTTRIYSTKEASRGKDIFDAKLLIKNGKCLVRLAPLLSRERARVAVAHEVGHWLVRAPDGILDDRKLNLPTSKEEEVLVEYCARQLLLNKKINQFGDEKNLALRCVKIANAGDTTIHASAERLGDPDKEGKKVEAVILWRLNPEVSASEEVSLRMSPQWKLCENHFIPIMRCHVRRNSVISNVASSEKPSFSLEADENVSIGSLNGFFSVHAFAWGSVEEGTRVVLSIFVHAS